MTESEAIKDIEGIKRVNGSKSLDIAIKALEKQISIEHHHTKVDKIKDCRIRLSICPKCLYGIYTAEQEYPRYCSWCGQKLDWSEV